MTDLLGNMGRYFQEHGLRIALAVCVVIAGIVVTWLLAFIIKRIMYKTKIDAAAVSFTVAVFKIVMALVIVLVCASLLDLSTSSLLVSLSSVALAVGLSLKDSFSNLANGVLIISTKPFKRGDLVSINGIEGKVQNIRLLTVELITANNTKIVMPNSSVLNGNVINYSAMPVRRVDMTYTVAYGSDMDKVEQTLKDLCVANELVLKTIPYLVFMQSHDSSAVAYSVRVWVKTDDYFTVLNGFPRSVYDAFAAEKINIPFNQLDVHICNDGPSK